MLWPFVLVNLRGLQVRSLLFQLSEVFKIWSVTSCFNFLFLTRAEVSTLNSRAFQLSAMPCRCFDPTDMWFRVFYKTVTCCAGKPAHLPDLPLTTQLSRNVVRVLGCNPSSFTMQGTNTYLIGTGRRRLLIDTGEGAGRYARVLKRAMAELGVEAIERVLITHGHFDHVGGIPTVLRISPGASVHRGNSDDRLGAPLTGEWVPPGA